MPSSSDLRLILAAGATIALAAFFVSAHEARGLRRELTVERQKAQTEFLKYSDAKAQIDGTMVVAQQEARALKRSLDEMGVRLARTQRKVKTVPPLQDTTAQRIVTHLTQEVDSLQAAYAEVVAELDTLNRALVAERKATRVLAQAADSTIAAQQALITALEAPEKPCTVLGLPCPTPTQAALAGLILGLFVGVVR
jgi:chromosome segregation ATPase